MTHFRSFGRFTRGLAFLAALLSLSGDWIRAQTSSLPLDFEDAAILGTRSIQMDRESEIRAGHAVVNNAAGNLWLGPDVRTPAGFSLVADKMRIDRDARVRGNVFYNVLISDKRARIDGARNTPIASFPIFDTLPPFNRLLWAP